MSVPAANRIGGAGTGWATWHETMLDGIVLLAAYAMGGARFALDTTVQYAKDRQQFDKPLGAFQADRPLPRRRVDRGRTAARSSCTRRRGRAPTATPIDRLAPMAKLFACQTFRDVTAMGHQVHGGMGFTVECDMQLYFRRAKELQISWWNDRYLEELVAAATLDRDDVPPSPAVGVRGVRHRTFLARIGRIFRPQRAKQSWTRDIS